MRFLAPLPRWWDWNISAQARVASLASAWLLVAFASAPMTVLAPVAALRFAASMVQTLWNHQLDRRQPLGARGLLDWAMLAGALGASTLVSALDRSGVTMGPTIAYSFVLAPLSVIQVRATRRSLTVYREASGLAGRVIPFSERVRGSRAA